MNMHVSFSDEIEATASRKKNIAACNMLLSELIRHHSIGGRLPLCREVPADILAKELDASLIKELPEPEPVPEVDESAITPRVTIEDVIKHTCKLFKVSGPAIRGSYRGEPLVTARHIAMYLSSRVACQTASEIGRRMSRDHSSILHGIRKTHTAIEGGDTIIINAVNAITFALNEAVANGTNALSAQRQVKTGYCLGEKASQAAQGIAS